MANKYKPIVVAVEMSSQGYWRVTVSTSPWQRVSVIIGQPAISRDQLTSEALAVVSHLIPHGEVS